MELGNYENRDQIRYLYQFGRKKLFKRIHAHFIELDKFKLFQYSPLAILKNDSAEKMRSIAIDIYNINNGGELALECLIQGNKLAVTETIRNKIEFDKKQIKENLLWVKM